ncbi:MAG: hypothetical protein WCH99_00255 [Verrucomicrobiota bacterium]
MTTYIKCYRKAEPKEILDQLAPLLKEKNFMWAEIVGAFLKQLRRRGFEIYIQPNELSDQMAGEVTYLCITDERPTKFEQS